MRRLTKADRLKRLEQADSLAVERATTFRLQKRTRTGEALGGHKLHEATGAVRKRNLIDKGARPVLASSEWRTIYREVGLA